MADDPDTLTCPQCGAVSPANQRFCGNCGAPLVAASVTTPVAEAPIAEAPVATAPVVPPNQPPASAGDRGMVGGGRPAVSRALDLPAAPVSPASAARERDRLLTLANVQRVRGQFAEARASVETVLTLSEGMSNREIAPVHELRGDLLQAEGRWEEAQSAFEKAHSLDTERVGAERKFAEATLRIAEAKAIASGSMLGMQSDSFGAGAFGGGSRGKRNTGVAVIASLFVPGFGQFVNGELVKGGICLGVFLLTMVALRLSPDSVILFAKINALVSPSGPAAVRALEPLSPLLVVLLVLLGINWAYSIFDAAAGASKSQDTVKGNVPPAGDRSGWEV